MYFEIIRFFSPENLRSDLQKKATKQYILTNGKTESFYKSANQRKGGYVFVSFFVNPTLENLMRRFTMEQIVSCVIRNNKIWLYIHNCGTFYFHEKGT